jgi:hypothetical protein
VTAFTPKGHERHETGTGSFCMASWVIRSILDFGMQLVKVREIACRLNIRDCGMDKTNLIRSIQRAENNRDCYGTERAKCCQEKACLWRKDCMSLVRTRKPLLKLDGLCLNRNKPAGRGISMISHNFLSKNKQDRRQAKT